MANILRESARKSSGVAVKLVNSKNNSTHLNVVGGIDSPSNQRTPPTAESSIDQDTPPARVVGVEDQGEGVATQASGTYDANPRVTATGSPSFVAARSRDSSCLNIRFDLMCVGFHSFSYVSWSRKINQNLRNILNF